MAETRSAIMCLKTLGIKWSAKLLYVQSFSE